MGEFFELGFKATVVATRLDKSLLGRSLNRALLAEIEGLGSHLCGENGEYHSFVTDGPIFNRALKVTTGEITSRDDAWFLDISVESQV